MFKRYHKKITAVILSLMLVFTSFPVMAAAAEDTGAATGTTQEAEKDFASSLALKKAASHSYYERSTKKVKKYYGKGNYLYSSLTLTGTAMGRERIISVKKLESLAYDKSRSLGYCGTYSMVTNGAEFSKSNFTGVKVYDLLLYYGMDDSLPDDTSVTFKSVDGYTNKLTLEDLRVPKYNSYSAFGMDYNVTEGMPVIVAFGSNGLPLVGPTGSQSTSYKVPAAGGYSEKADNAGGPLRLVIGQTSSDNFNANSCSKWLSEIIVGDEAEYVKNQGEAADKKGLTVNVYDSNDKKILTKDFTVGEIQDFSDEANAFKVKKFYTASGFYEGAVIWKLIERKMDLPVYLGKVTFNYKDGSRETIYMRYLRNVNGDFENYYNKIGNRKVTAVKPMLAYGKNGKPIGDGDIYAMLPANGKEKKKYTRKEIKSIKIKLNKYKEATNPYRNSTIEIGGEGIETGGVMTVGELEKQISLHGTAGDFKGCDLYSLLEGKGLTADAGNVTLSNGTDSVTYTVKELAEGDVKAILATRKNGKAIKPASGGPVYLKGDEELKNVKTVTVDIKEGQWTHDEGIYRRYLETELKISGSGVEEKIYTVGELEALGDEFTVRDSFGAGGGTFIYQGVILRELIKENLVSGVEKPSAVTVIADGYEIELDVDLLWSGVESLYQEGQFRDYILAYGKDGKPMVPANTSPGYDREAENDFGPIRLIVENEISKWVKCVTEVNVEK